MPHRKLASRPRGLAERLVRLCREAGLVVGLSPRSGIIGKVCPRELFQALRDFELQLQQGRGSLGMRGWPKPIRNDIYRYEEILDEASKEVHSQWGFDSLFASDWSYCLRTFLSTNRLIVTTDEGESTQPLIVDWPFPKLSCDVIETLEYAARELNRCAKSSPIPVVEARDLFNSTGLLPADPHQVLKINSAAVRPEPHATLEKQKGQTPSAKVAPKSFPTPNTSEQKQLSTKRKLTEEARETILGAYKNVPGALSLAQLAKRSGYTEGTLKHYLPRLVEEGILEIVHDGYARTQVA